MPVTVSGLARRPTNAWLPRSPRQRGWTCGATGRRAGDSYLGRVPKALIVEAVQEAVGPGPAGRMAGSKKEMMVADATQLLHGTGWLPALLRVPAGSPEDAADPEDVTEAALAMAAE